MRHQGEDVPLSASDKPYLVDNNRELNMAALEERMALMLADAPLLPEAHKPLPSMQPVASPSFVSRLVARLRRSYLISQWLPRHPTLYRRVRAVYQWLKPIIRRQ